MSSSQENEIYAAYQSKNYEHCLSLAKAALVSSPSNVSFKMMKAACGAFLAIEFEENVEMLKQIIADDPNNGLAFFALGNCYYYEGEMGDCLEYFKKAIAMGAGVQRAIHLKQKASIVMSTLCDVDAKFEQDEVFTAIEILNAIPLIDSNNKKIREKIDRIKQYYLEMVIKRLEVSVNNELENQSCAVGFETLAAKAEALIDTKNVAEALGLIAKMEKLEPEAEAVHCLHGYAQYMTGQLKEAILSFDKAVKINRNNVKARKLLMKATKLEKLIEDAEEVSKIEKNSAKAIELLTEALKVDSSNFAVNQAIYLHRSFHYFKVSEFPSAIGDFQKIQDSGVSAEDLRKLMPVHMQN